MEKQKEKLVLDNMKLAYSIALKYKNKVAGTFEFEDAIQMCLEGLVNAANSFDETKGVAFSTYAYTVIRNHLITPSLVRTKKQRGAIVISLDEPLTTDDEFSLLSTIADDFDVEIYNADNDEIAQLYKHINELPKLQKEIMILRCKDKTFDEISKILSISQTYTQQQYQKGLNILRHKFRVRKG